MAQVGGRFIGEGKFGCAFMPPLLCKGQTQQASTADLVSKISTKEEVKSELAIANVLQQIPLSRNYLIYSIDLQACVPEVAAKQKEKELYQCEQLQKQGSLSTFYMYKMPYGGIPIGESKYGFNYWKMGKHLLEGLSLLLVYGVVHMDLHTGNLVIDKESRIPRIFDWGWANLGPNASRIEMESLAMTNFATKYTQQPPEISLFQAAYNNMPLDLAIQEIYKGRSHTVNMIHILLGLDKSLIYEQLGEFRNNTLYLERKLDFYAWWKTHWHTYDAWSVGYVLLKICFALNTNRRTNLFEKPFYADKKEKIVTALRGLCNFNCFDRLNAVQALAIWDSPQNPIIQRFGRKWL